MCFRKSNTFIILFVLLFFNGINTHAQESLIKIDNHKNYVFNSAKLDVLVSNDSLYKATVLLHNAINFSKENNLRITEAKSYNALSSVLAKLSNFKKAEAYHNQAFKIYDSLQDRKGIDRTLSGLLNTYLLAKNYHKFDSIYPKTQEVSRKLNSELYFVNLENKIKKDYYSYDNKSMFEVANKSLNILNSTDFESLNFSGTSNNNNLKQNLLQSYKYHKALALIKLAKYKSESYDLLFSIDENELKASLKNNINSYRKLATFNYYKYRFYSENEINPDSANKYLLKSDAYKYDALADIEQQQTKHGDLIYKIFNSEQKLSLANQERIKDAKATKLFLTSTIIIGLFLIVTLIIFYFYFKAKKNILEINEALKTSNSKLIDIDKNRMEFFSILSHELRTPIYGITGLATLIDQEDDSSKKQQYLNSLMSSSNYISTLIDNILQANKLKFEEKSLHLKPAKIDQIVKHVLSTVQVAAKNKDLELLAHIDSSAKKDFILIDKTAFSQILINLVYNAIRYTLEGSVKINVFTVKRAMDEITLRFEIVDTGIGIKEEHRAVVFSAFENKTFLDKNSTGSGLGLFIVKTLLKSHKTEIDFISDPEIGTTFFFEIDFQTLENISGNTDRTRVIDRVRKVLVVDDNKINLLITKKNIEKIGGFVCQTSSNGKEALSMIKVEDFDIIFMDINMPEMDGFEVTKHIRKFNRHIPVIALTALNTSEILEKSKVSGINQIITKPYVFEDFKDVILNFSDSDKYDLIKK